LTKVPFSPAGWEGSGAGGRFNADELSMASNLILESEQNKNKLS
jgi:hypothetical protein